MDEPDAGLGGSAGRTGVQQARAHLMGGRGPGASASEIERHTRGRVELAGQPTPQRRAQLARQTALARGDTDALAAQITAATSELGATLAAIRHRVAPPGRSTGRLALIAATGFAAGVGIGAVQILVRCARHL